MQFETNKNLKHHNTFGIAATAARFVSVKSIPSLKKVLAAHTDENIFVLGGGSNILLLNTVEAIVLHINLKGISVVSQTGQDILIKAMAGENWHAFVLHCIKNNYGGVENLSLIPGNVGAAPIQNIGAYGVELKDVFESCTAVSIKTQQEKTFTNADCKFGYRNSILKNGAKGQFVVTSVTFRLTKNHHRLHTSYGTIADELKKNGIARPTLKNISDAVMAIRQRKLPDPSVLGNSGSFFKNPVLGVEDFKKFNKKFPTAPFYEVPPAAFKVPAAWLIEQAGYKGKRFGNAGVHANQALVLVNFGGATGAEIWHLARRVQKAVLEKFNIKIEPEVQVVGKDTQ